MQSLALSDRAAILDRARSVSGISAVLVALVACSSGGNSSTAASGGSAGGGGVSVGSGGSGAAGASQMGGGSAIGGTGSGGLVANMGGGPGRGGVSASGGAVIGGGGGIVGVSGAGGSNVAGRSSAGNAGVAGGGGTSGGESGGGSGMAGTGAAGQAGSGPTTLPTAKGSCPAFKDGGNQVTVNSKAMNWTMWVGQKAATPTGFVVIYWHGTGTSGQEATWALGTAGIQQITSAGGIVAAAEVTSNTGTTTGNNVWYTGDADYADEIVACAMKQLNIDPRRIYTGGYSAGALQTGYMYGARTYFAAVVVYSGGSIIPALPKGYVPPVLGAHGSTSGDFLASSTTSWEKTVKNAGAFVIDCDDGGSHVDISRLTNLATSTMTFLKDHPYNVGKPNPYATALPSGFLPICRIQ